MDDQITQWLDGVVQGDEAAIQHVWESCQDRLLRVARRKLGEGSRRVADEEDVALSAFNSFCKAAAEGRFPQLQGRQDLWRILVTITARKAGAQLRAARRQKRGGGAVRGESVFLQPDSQQSATPGLQGVPGESPTPALAALMAEQCERLLDCLDDDLLRQVARYKLEGYSNEEIAETLQCAPRTVERKLARIRERWQTAGLS